MQEKRERIAAQQKEKRPGWTSLLLEASGRDRTVGPLKGEARRRIRIEMLPPHEGNDRSCYRRRRYCG